MTTELIIPHSKKRAEREAEDIAFAERLKQLTHDIDFKISSRGWAYQLEVFRLINKDQFNQIEKTINTLRKKGLLPIDFTAEEQGRQFQGVEWPNDNTPEEHLRSYLESALVCEQSYVPELWEGEEYYIQMVVEKIDLVSLFEPVCRQYHIPIATSSGWASMLMRAEYANRFKYWESKGLRPVLLYCGDFDPTGLQISDFLRENLRDLKDIVWSKGGTGFEPKTLTIDRFGLNYDFIIANNLTWIDNLKTGSKGEIAVRTDTKDPFSYIQGKTNKGKAHPDYKKPYVQDYLKRYGVKKCEANALIIAPDAARVFVTEAIERYLGHDSISRFREKHDVIRDRLDGFRHDTGLDIMIYNAIKTIEDLD